MRLVPSDVLPRWPFFAFLANTMAMHCPAVTAEMFDSNTVHVAVLSRDDVAQVGLGNVVPEGPTTRTITDDEGALVLCGECGVPVVFVPAENTDAGRCCAAVLLCLVLAGQPGVRVDQRVRSWVHAIPHAQALAAAYDIR